MCVCVCAFACAYEYTAAAAAARVLSCCRVRCTPVRVCSGYGVLDLVSSSSSVLPILLPFGVNVEDFGYEYNRNNALRS